MNTSRKLRVKMPYEPPYPRQEICGLEEARQLFVNREPGIVIVEGQIVSSYEDMKAIVLEKCEEAEMIDVILLPLFDGG